MTTRNAVLSLFAAAAMMIPSSFVAAQGTGTQPETKPEPAKQPEGEKPKTDEKTEEKPKEEAKLVYVKMKTSMGDIVLELNHEKAPITVKNFLSYLDKGHYDGTIFHRVINGFMIQGGGFSEELKQKDTDKPIKNEWKNGLKNKRGTIAMARTNDPDSASSQFFINVVDNDKLDEPISGGAGYAVFGRVISGMDTVDKIKAVQTSTKVFANRQQMGDAPVKNVVIEKVTRMTEDEGKKAAGAGTTPEPAKKP